MRRIGIFLALVALNAAAGAKPPAQIVLPTARLDAYFDALDKQGLTNGAIAISQKGVLRYQRFVGFAALEPTGPWATDEGTRYRIGSVSNLFTAALTMQLVESASIGLDSRLAEFFPELPNALDITYRDLLQHRSGLTNYTSAPEFAQWRFAPPDRAELLKAIGTLAPPRERVEYNETNYLLLSFILEKVYEKPYADIVRRHIIDKIGLPRTSYGAQAERSRMESRSYVHTAEGWKPERETDPDIYLGAGGMVSTPADLVRFIDMLFARKIVTAQSLATMRGEPDGPGAGLSPWTAAGRTGYGQTGGIDHHAAWVWHSPETGISIACATNGSTVPLEEIANEVLALIFERGHVTRAR